MLFGDPSDPRIVRLSRVRGDCGHCAIIANAGNTGIDPSHPHHGQGDHYVPVPGASLETNLPLRHNIFALFALFNNAYYVKW